MIKKLFILSTAAILLAACKKERTCTCTVYTSGGEVKTVKTEAKVRKRDFRLKTLCYDRITKDATGAVTNNTRCILK
jgi:hypothetical protein